MRKLRIVLIAAASAVAGVFLFVVLVSLFVPDDVVEGALRRSLEENASVTFSAGEFKMSFPFTIAASRVLVFPLKGAHPQPGDGGAVYFETMNARLRPLSLLWGEVRVDLRGGVGNGLIESSAAFGRNSINVDVMLSGTDASAFPFHGAAGVNLSGAVSGRAYLVFRDKGGCPDGTVSLKGSDVAVEGPALAWVALLFKERVDVSLSAQTMDCAIKLNGLWVEGREFSARLHGDLKLAEGARASAVSLTVELFPKQEAVGGAHLMLLERYRKSANYYSMQVKGTVDAPTVTP